MISFFTDPYEGELITHAVARYIEYEGNTVSRGLINVFSTYSITGCLSFGNMIEKLATMIGGKYKADYLINNFTIVPYYKLFCSQKKYQKLYEYIMSGSSNEKKRSTALIHVSKCLKKSLIYCEACIKEDIDLYGEPYLHREHYLCGANTCYKHKLPLLEYEIDNGFTTLSSKLKLLPKSYDSLALDIFKEIHILSKRQTELAVKILNMNIDIYREGLAQVYIDRLKELGIMRENSIAYNELYKIIEDVYGKIGLTILKPYLNPENIKNHLLFNPENFIEPSIHLLFIMALWEKDDLFIDKCIKQSSIQEEPQIKEVIVSKERSCRSKRYRTTDISTISANDCTIKVVGAAHRYIDIIENTMSGPWKCKDAVCKKYIELSTVKYDTSKKELRQEVCCTCGCHYITSIGVEENTGRYKMKILDYSDRTKEIIIEKYVNLGVGVERIAKELGISYRYVRNYIISQDITLHPAAQYKMLEMELPITESEIINYFWQDYLDFISDFPNTPKSLLIKIGLDKYKKDFDSRYSLYELMLQKHEKIIDNSKAIIKEYRSKEKAAGAILKNNILMRAISYLRLYAQDELAEIVLNPLGKEVSDKDINQLIIDVEKKYKNGIEVTKEKLMQEYPRVMYYLNKYSPDKIDEIIKCGNSLENISRDQEKIKQTDEDKDLQYELLIQSISKELYNREPPVRITKTLLSKKLDEARIRRLDKKQYPRAFAAIGRVCESRGEYKLRVCKQIIDKMDFRLDNVSISAIFRKAKVHDPKIYKDIDIRLEVMKYLEERGNN